MHLENREIKIEKEEEICSICLGAVPAFETETLGCKHKFHKKCIERWLSIKSTCPICRRQMQNKIDKSRTQSTKKIYF
uniref:RING-type E3 ubiquitin transferase n=1 Tax=Ditylenchus dipsaci TaxID=166011 RepID=A0A915CYV9_9BILA